MQEEAPFLKAKKERELGGTGLLDRNDLGESFSRRRLPARLDAYQRLRQERQKDAELAILSSPPLDVEAIWQGCWSPTPSASKR